MTKIDREEFLRLFESFNVAMRTLGETAKETKTKLFAAADPVADAERYYNERMADVHARRKERQRKSAERRKKKR